MGDHPSRIGPYEIILPIAKGGMATVFLARSEGVGGFDRYVALKLTAPALRNDPLFAKHLIEEGKLVAHLRHTNVVPVLDVGECDDGVYLVMEYVPGDSLSGLIRTGRASEATLPLKVAIRVLCDALLGLHAAHEHTDEEGHSLKIVHRDFSPQNILVGTDGVARLTDFGIAKAASRASTTVTGLIKGKISYVSPEQARGLEMDRRSDLWSAGIVAWELLAGRKLHGTNDKALLDIVKGDPPRVSTVYPNVPPELDDAIARVLVTNPDHRTKTAAQLARELSDAARGAGLLAEREEVADQVARLAGATLAQRKAQIAEKRRTRVQSSPDVLKTVQGVPPPPALRRQLPSLPDVPVQTLDVPVDVGTEEPAHERARTPTTPREVLRPRAAMPVVSRTAIVAIAASAAGLVVFVVILAFVIGGRGGGESAAADASASSMPAAVTAPSSNAVVAPKPTAHDDTVWPVVVEIAADEPIAQVRVNGRVTDLAMPTQKVNIELEPGEDPNAVQVTARSAKGRSASGTARGGSVKLSFAR